MVAEREVIWAAWTMFSGAVGIAVVSFGTAAANEPTIAAPHSLTVLLPLMDRWGATAYLIWPMAFLLWSIQLFARVPQIPVRSAVLACVAVLGSAVWSLVFWRDGMTHQGRTHVAIVAALNLLVALALTGILLRSRRRPSFAVSFAFHWVLFAWVSWSSLPWFGEGI